MAHVILIDKRKKNQGRKNNGAKKKEEEKLTTVNYKQRNLDTTIISQNSPNWT